MKLYIFLFLLIKILCNNNINLKGNILKTENKCDINDIDFELTYSTSSRYFNGYIKINSLNKINSNEIDALYCIFTIKIPKYYDFEDEIIIKPVEYMNYYGGYLPNGYNYMACGYKIENIDEICFNYIRLTPDDDDDDSSNGLIYYYMSFSLIPITIVFIIMICYCCNNKKKENHNDDKENKKGKEKENIDVKDDKNYGTNQNPYKKPYIYQTSPPPTMYTQTNYVPNQYYQNYSYLSTQNVYQTQPV